jgi:cell division protein FtsB
MKVLCIILALLCIILLIGIRNLLVRNEKQEDVLAIYLDYMDQLSKHIEYIDAKIQKLDQKGTFRSDDEIGFFFEEVKKMQTKLQGFKTLADDKTE